MQNKRNTKLLFFVAFTQLKDRKTQTIVATAGVTFGIAIFIFLLSCVKGINDYVTDLSLEQCPHIRLFNEIQVMEQLALDRLHPHDENLIYHTKPNQSLLYLRNGKIAIQEIAKNPLVAAVSGSVKTQVFYHVGSGGLKIIS